METHSQAMLCRKQCFGVLSSSNEGDQNVPGSEDFQTFSIPSTSYSSFSPEASHRKQNSRSPASYGNWKLSSLKQDIKPRKVSLWSPSSLEDPHIRHPDLYLEERNATQKPRKIWIERPPSSPLSPLSLSWNLSSNHTCTWLSFFIKPRHTNRKFPRDFGLISQDSHVRQNFD